jgi:hypothetical protein
MTLDSTVEFGLGVPLESTDTGHMRECMVLAVADLAQFLINVDAH